MLTQEHFLSTSTQENCLQNRIAYIGDLLIKGNCSERSIAYILVETLRLNYRERYMTTARIAASWLSSRLPILGAAKQRFTITRRVRAMSQIKYTLQDTVSLPPNNVAIPRLGLGVFMAKGPKCATAVSAALKCGYRHIDSAQYYGNEVEVGQGVRNSGVQRDQIFVTTKIMSPAGSVEKSFAAVKRSVEKMGIGYVDCFLIHTPGSGSQGRRELWSALEKLQKEGLTKTIGVSNYGVHHLEEMKEYAKIYPPCLNQIEVGMNR